MVKRKFDAKLRKVGNSYVITVPMETIERFELEEGDYLAINFDSDDIKKTKKEDKNKNGQST